MKEWPEELLEIFDDPLLAHVRPLAPKPTAHDRSAQKLEEIIVWVEKHGREPRQEGDLKEKLLAASLKALRRSNELASLKQYDRLNLLKDEH